MLERKYRDQGSVPKDAVDGAGLEAEIGEDALHACHLWTATS